MNNTKYNIEEKINQVLQQEMSLPDGLLERIEANIDSLGELEVGSRRTKRSKFRTYTIYSMGVAATLALVLLAIDFIPKQADTKYPTIIYSEVVGTQQNAEQLVDKAMRLFAHNINKGVQVIEKGDQEIEKTRKKISNILKRVRK